MDDNYCTQCKKEGKTCGAPYKSHKDDADACFSCAHANGYHSPQPIATAPVESKVPRTPPRRVNDTRIENTPFGSKASSTTKDTLQAEKVSGGDFSFTPGVDLLALLNMDEKCADQFVLMRNLSIGLRADKSDPLNCNWSSEDKMQTAFVEKLTERNVDHWDTHGGMWNSSFYSTFTEAENTIITLPFAMPDVSFMWGKAEIKLADEDAVIKQALERLYRDTELKQHFKIIVSIARTPKTCIVFVCQREAYIESGVTSYRKVTKSYKIDPEFMLPLITELSAQELEYFLLPEGPAIVNALAELGVNHELCRVSFMASHGNPVYSVCLPVAVKEDEHNTLIRRLEEVIYTEMKTDTSHVVVLGREDNGKSARIAVSLQNASFQKNSAEESKIKSEIGNLQYKLDLKYPQLVVKYIRDDDCLKREVAALDILPETFLVTPDRLSKNTIVNKDVAGAVTFAALQSDAYNKKCPWKLPRVEDGAELRNYTGAAVVMEMGRMENYEPFTLQTLNESMKQAHHHERVHIQQNMFVAMEELSENITQIHVLNILHTDLRFRNACCFWRNERWKWMWIDFEYAIIIRVEESEVKEYELDKRVGVVNLPVKVSDSTGERRRRCGPAVEELLAKEKGGRASVNWTTNDDLEMWNMVQRFS